MFKDLRDYLEHLERRGMLLKVKKEVSPRFEIAAGIRKVADTDGPALLFENVKGYPGWRVGGRAICHEEAHRRGSGDGG